MGAVASVAAGVVRSKNSGETAGGLASVGEAAAGSGARRETGGASPRSPIFTSVLFVSVSELILAVGATAISGASLRSPIFTSVLFVSVSGLILAVGATAISGASLRSPIFTSVLFASVSGLISAVEATAISGASVFGTSAPLSN